MLARRVVVILLSSLLVFVACKRKEAIPPDVIVRVGDRMVTLGDFRRYLERNAGTDLAQLTPEVASAMLDQFVEEIVISEYAESHGIEVPSDRLTAAVRTEARVTVVEKRDEMRREQLVADLAAKVRPPDEAQLRAYYSQHPEEFRSGEEVRVRQILVNDETLANEILRKLKNGESFGDLSSQYSRAPNARRGGEIGFVSRGELPKMFEEEIFKLQPGDVTPVIRTDTSFHIFMADERRPAGTVDFASAVPLIEARLREEAVRQELARIVTESRKEMSLAVLTRRLPFRYSGTLPKAQDE